MSTTERTFIAVKPDGVQRGLVGDIIARFEKRGFKLVALKMVHAEKKLLETHYQDLSAKPFYAGLVKYMASGPVVAMVWEGLAAVKTGRVMLGATNPLDSLPGMLDLVTFPIYFLESGWHSFLSSFFLLICCCDPFLRLSDGLVGRLID